MTKRLFLTCLATALTLSTGGCMFWKKSAKPKEDSSISSATEDSLKQRWLEKRTAELVAQGATAEAARTQATDEFRTKYSFTDAAKK